MRLLPARDRQTSALHSPVVTTVELVGLVVSVGVVSVGVVDVVVGVEAVAVPQATVTDTDTESENTKPDKQAILKINGTIFRNFDYETLRP